MNGPWTWAAKRDASCVRGNPGIGTKYHAVKDEKNEVAGCGALISMGDAIEIGDVPKHLRCQKSVCKRMFSTCDKEPKP